MSLNVPAALLERAVSDEVADAEFADNATPPPSESERGQLLNQSPELRDC
jgi:hypothetical protein